MLVKVCVCAVARILSLDMLDIKLIAIPKEAVGILPDTNM